MDCQYVLFGGEDWILGHMYLRALRQRVANGELGHVIPLLPQGNKIVVYPCLVLARVVEVELLRLHIVFAQLLLFEFGDLFQETLLLLHRETPGDHDAVLEEEDLGYVHRRVEVGRYRSLERCADAGFGVQVVGEGVFFGRIAHMHPTRRASFVLQLHQILPPPLRIILDLDRAIREPSLWLRLHLLPLRLRQIALPPPPTVEFFPVGVGRVYTLVKQLRLRVLRLAPPFQEPHQVIQPITPRSAIRCHSGQLIPIILPQPRRIPSRRRILDPRKLTVHIPPTLLIRPILNLLRIRQQFQLLRPHRAPLGSDLARRVLRWQVQGCAGAVAAPEFAVERGEHGLGAIAGGGGY